MPGESPNEPRFCLSHFPPRYTSWKPIGPQTARRSCCADVRFANGIPSSVTDTVASRRTMNITIGSGFVAVGVPAAGRLSPSYRRFRSLTLTTVCWPAARHCSGVLRSTAPGKRRRPHSKTPIACPIPPPSVAGLTVWTLPSQPVPFYTKRSPASLVGWRAGIGPIPGPGHCPS